MSKIENHQYSIEEAFRNCFYIVPDYQREFVWTEKEVSKLLEDISNEVGNSQYFVGTVLVSPNEQKNHFDVIDGQQRLTTFFLILCALRLLFKGEEQEKSIDEIITTKYTTKQGDVKSSLKLTPRYENSEELINALVKINDTPNKLKAELNKIGINQFGSLENLVNAYTTVYNYIDNNFPEIDDLKRFWGYLSNSVVFIQISTDVSSALKIFETINERGLGLNPMDLLKNLLFTHIDHKKFTDLKNEWKKITKPLEKNKEKPLRFLRYFIMANYKVNNKRNDNIVREDEIYDWFTKKENAKLCQYKEKPFEFVRKVIEDVNTYIEFSNGKGNDGNNNIYMDNIRKLAGGAFSLHYILLLASKPLPTDLFNYLLKQIESFMFYYIITRTPTKILERNFSLWADELREIVSIQNTENQKIALNDFIKNRLVKSTKSKQSEFENALARYNFFSLQQYRTRYILAKLTQFVDMEYQGVKKPSTLDYYLNLEIEHILPQNPEKELKENFEGFDKKTNKAIYDYDDFKNKLGNLTLLEKPINIVAGRKFFGDKKLQYKKSKNYLTASIAQINNVGNNSSINRVNKYLKSFDDWDANAINKRQLLLTEIAKIIWKVEPISD